jgi:hypothetical protein
MARFGVFIFFLLATTLTANAQLQIDDPLEIEGSPASASDGAENGPDAGAGAPDDETPEPHHVRYVSPLAPPQLPEAAPDGFQWGPAVRQSMLLLGVQHTFRMTELKTRRELDGPFFRDWFDAVKSLQGWEDGGRQFTNYVAHPMQGALYGYIQVQNDPGGARREFGGSKGYWKSRAKAMGWSALWSTQFELGPVSQASLGNVGAGEFEAKKMAWVDLVITPTVGTAWLVAEDAIDRYVVRWIERRTQNRLVRSLARMALNPMRSCANVLRFKPMWHRDTRR